MVARHQNNSTKKGVNAKFVHLNHAHQSVAIHISGTPTAASALVCLNNVHLANPGILTAAFVHESVTTSFAI